jgi:hypothetical protein
MIKTSRYTYYKGSSQRPMKRTLISTLAVLLVMAAFGISSAQPPAPHSQWAKQKPTKGRAQSAKKNGEKPFDELIKDKVKIEGLFTFYHDTTDNSMLMEIKPEQFDQMYLCGMTVLHGDGAFVEGSRMFGTIPFYLHRVGNTIQFMEKNLRVRADSTAPIYGAVEAGISDALIASTAVKSEPQDSTSAILVDPSPFFVRDALNLTYYLGQAKTGFHIDPKNSYFGQVKSFSENTEINVVLHFESSKPAEAVALQNPYSFFHTFRYSLATLPETDYVPRLADDRIGHFMTMYQDYDQLDRETPYVRFINRWDLKKKNPGARISEPVKPIVFWIENTVPEEYRDAIAEGIEFWQPAFEAIGFRNAIIAKQMPDTASWDPADVRYSAIRWLVAKNYPYTAIGTSRANPVTGQVYDADIGFVSDAIRGLFLTIERQVKPVTPTRGTFEEYDPFGEIADFANNYDGPHVCDMGQAAFEAAFGLSYLSATGDLKDKDELTKKYVEAFLRFVIAHEVGHTLGFRHNFGASSIYTLDEINNEAFTEDHSSVGSIMEYPAPNIAGPEHKQGEFYASVPGPYDYWAIEYSYSDFGSKSPFDEVEQLNKIASRAGDSDLFYATDEDAYGTSMKSIDPRVNIWDLGNDPLAFAEHNIDLSRTIWFDAINEFEQPGERYQKIRNVFNTSWTPYYRAAFLAPKYVGGLYQNRLHIGDADENPFRPVPAAKQRRAVEFIRDYLFAPDVFNFPPELINKLQEETLPDFNWTNYSRTTVEYQIMRRVDGLYQAVLSRLYSPFVLGRLINNVERFQPDEEKYTIYDMFTDVRRAVWSEIVEPQNVNEYRRHLQLAHLDRIIDIYLSSPLRMPSDARTLAANDLDILEEAAGKAIQSTAIDGMTKAHFKEVFRQIEAAKRARREYSGR